MKLKRITRPGDSRGPTATQFTAVPYLRTVSNKQAGRLLPMRNVCPTTCAPPLRTFPRARNSSAHSPLLHKPNRLQLRLLIRTCLRLRTPKSLRFALRSLFRFALRSICASHSEVFALRTPNLLRFALRSLCASHSEAFFVCHPVFSALRTPKSLRFALRTFFASHSEVFALRTPKSSS